MNCVAPLHWFSLLPDSRSSWALCLDAFAKEVGEAQCCGGRIARYVFLEG